MGFLVGFVWGILCSMFLPNWLEDRGWKWWQAWGTALIVLVIGLFPLAALFPK